MYTFGQWLCIGVVRKTEMITDQAVAEWTKGVAVYVFVFPNDNSKRKVARLGTYDEFEASWCSRGSDICRATPPSQEAVPQRLKIVGISSVPP